MFERKCLSTGVIKKDANNVDAHIEIVNLNDFPVTVCVFALNWDANPPTALSVVPGSPFVIPGNSNQPFDVNLTGVSDHYEIRVSIPTCEVIANVFALRRDVTIVEGNTVLFEDLIRISKCTPCTCRKRRYWDEEE